MLMFYSEILKLQAVNKPTGTFSPFTALNQDRSFLGNLDARPYIHKKPSLASFPTVRYVVILSHLTGIIFNSHQEEFSNASYTTSDIFSLKVEG